MSETGSVATPALKTLGDIAKLLPSSTPSARIPLFAVAVLVVVLVSFIYCIAKKIIPGNAATEVIESILWFGVVVMLLYVLYLLGNRYLSLQEQKQEKVKHDEIFKGTSE
ncbi:MAG: hypothetical protein JSV52_03965 [Candidatus Zixiibacteriota bacterium]|nr:MAG: hypothetical protein JSV52_03965 [candidate division Zixibacteria bacterium]